MSGNWKNEKLYRNTTPEARSIFIQFKFFQFPRELIYITVHVYQYG